MKSALAYVIAACLMSYSGHLVGRVLVTNGNRAWLSGSQPERLAARYWVLTTAISGIAGVLASLAFVALIPGGAVVGLLRVFVLALVAVLVGGPIIAREDSLPQRVLVMTSALLSMLPFALLGLMVAYIMGG